ncbi:uncharacterized protein PGTG_05012 [Puccinia graminis f. sp. tritici CRL 75-36-700-3]|uniref:Uncharacterized protein n=1 Tax=Puccinia graminis f. sp. tritici (strain CRL 75-36-700-3 / race SCCL) TaxID=418459 RepID=E3K3J9_PUCGT|nr:uncharacterized protein PGTG_05012 [Puccinia graminis f. sp. tritici CRL 75-36-700-3]EFP79056.2 hypothetical protein PGTG_05012 [Puccinia graminis f. sp. tritici CRL 75-36-700-3]
MAKQDSTPEENTGVALRDPAKLGRLRGKAIGAGPGALNSKPVCVYVGLGHYPKVPCGANYVTAKGTEQHDLDKLFSRGVGVLSRRTVNEPKVYKLNPNKEKPNFHT